jgi:glycosyltransferase involved in cell wall biosynthesis
VSFPRLLFLTPAAFNHVTGGGITFTHLFAGWPRDRIATVHNDPVPISCDVCERYYRLGNNELVYPAALERLMRAANAGTDASAGTPAREASGRTSYRLLRAAKWAVFGDAVPQRGVLSASLRQWVRSFRPELVYTILGSNAMMELALAIAEEAGARLAVHMMDDWPATLYRGGALSIWQRARMNSLLRVLFRKAASRMAICEDMRSAYERRYGLPFTAFQNAVDPTLLGALRSQKSLRPGNEVRVAYTGSILPFAQLESLIDCCRAIARLRAAGASLRLDIYSPLHASEQYRRRLEVDAAVQLHDTIRDDAAYFRVLVESDILLLPVNFDAFTIRYIRYSMPTKVPAYLFSGTPVLVYGPPQVAQVKYAQRGRWGYTVLERREESLDTALRRLSMDVAERVRLSNAAYETASLHHDLASVRHAFRRELERAAQAR